MPTPQLILASSSPRRRELLGLSGLDFEVRPAAADETPRPDESPEAFAQRMSHTKAALVAAAVAGSGRGDAAGTVIVGADTIVVLDTPTAPPSILGKPSGPAQAVEMLQRLRARRHRVLTAISVLDTAISVADTAAPAQRDDLVTASVPMRAYSDDDIHAYVATGNPLDKAGAYAIQFAAFQPVDRPGFHDCFATVMGLPVCTVLGLLAQAGVRAPLAALPADCHHFDPAVCPIYPLINQGGQPQ